MSSPTAVDYYKHALLATAAYVRTGGSTDSANFVALASTTDANRIPRILGESIFLQSSSNPVPWNILRYYGGDVPVEVDPIAAAERSGFAATLFQQGTAGEKVLAFRGTEPEAEGYIDLGGAGIGQIGILGIALTQVVSMINLIQRMKAEPGAAVTQIGINASNLPPGGDSLLVTGQLPMFLSFSTYVGTGIGGIAPGEKIKVTGHSLGGHLAYMAARIFPDVVDPQVHIYNSAGYNPWTADFLLLGGNLGLLTLAAGKAYLFLEFGNAAVGIDATANRLANDALRQLVAKLHGNGATEGSPVVINLNAEDLVPGDDFDLVSSAFTGANNYPVPIALPTEVNSHVIEPLLDGLALQALLHPLLNGTALTLSEAIRLLEASSSQINRSEEALTEALFRLFLKNELFVDAQGVQNQRTLPLSDASGTSLGLFRIGKGGLAERAAFHDAVLRIGDFIKNRPGLQLASLLDTSPTALVSSAQGSDGIGHRYALRELNPFVISGDSVIYDPHNPRSTPLNFDGPLDLYNDASRTGILTPEWIADRAAFLVFNSIGNAADTSSIQTNQVSELWRYLDLPRRINLSVIPPGVGTPSVSLTRRVVFDGDDSDALYGGKVADRLYGAGGADFLEGRDANDYLEGGTGLDIYNYNGYAGLLGSNDGADTIRDIDGKGMLRYVWNDRPLPQSTVIADASVKVSDTEWRSANGKFIYTTTVNSQGRTDLVVTIDSDAGGTVTLKDFRDGDFGIRLWAARPAPQAFARTFYGDTENWDSDPSQDGIQPEPDGLGNYRRADGEEGREYIPLPERVDIFYGAPNTEVEFFVLGDNNDAAYADGTESSVSGAGGVDWIQGGSGRDELVGGAGNDVMEAGLDGSFGGETGGDIAYGALGDDAIYGTAEITLASAIATGESNAPTGLKGDLLSGGPGEDWLISGASHDFLLGGSDRDLLIAGAGDDNIFGDVDAVGTTLLWRAVRTITPDPVTGTDTYRIDISSQELLILSTDAGNNDAVYAGGGTDWIFAHDGDDFVDAGSGSDVAFGLNGDDVLIGGHGDDLLVGDSGPQSAAVGSDFLDGGAGNDTLQGDDGNDVLIGGPGDDALRGGAGKDIYVFNRGDGTETIFDTPDDPSKADASVLVLSDVSRNGIRFFPGSLGIDLGPSDPEDPDSPRDVIHIDGFDQVNPAATPLVSEIRFGDGESMSYDDILAQGFDIDGTAGNDNGDPGESPMLVGTGVTDRIYGLGGNDVLFGLAGGDLLDGGAGADQLIGGSGSDAIDAGDGDDQVWADDDESDPSDHGMDTVFGGLGNDVIRGYGGGDQLFGEDGSDEIWGEGGLDSLDGGAGDDRLHGGDGNDQVWGGDDADEVSGEHGADVVDGGAGNDVVYGDAVYMVLGTPLLNFLDDNAGDTLHGGEGNDTLNSGGGDDVLEGGTGNDRLEAEAGNDVLDGGDGADSLRGGAGADTLAGGAGDGDVLSGEAGDDRYVFNPGDGEDRVHDQPDTVLDVLAFGVGISRTDISFSLGTGNGLVAWHMNGTDQVSVPEWFLGAGYRLDHFEFANGALVTSAEAEASASGSYRGGTGDDTLMGVATADTMYGLAGQDWLSGGNGNDTLIGGRGNDTLIGGEGGDLFRFALGDGADLIQETGLYDDTLAFDADIASTDVSYERVENDLVMRHVNGTDRITVFNWFTHTFSFKIQSTTFASDGTTYSGFTLDTLATAIPHQYSLSLGDGGKTIEDWGGVDTLTFGSGIAKADIAVTRTGADLRLAHVNGSDDAVVSDWFDDVNKQIENVVFAATGESFTHAELTNPFLTLAGTPANDLIDGGNAYGETISGLAGNDEIYGGDGADSITGGLGNDTIYGGMGVDRYFFRAGDGADIVTEEDTGTMLFGPGMVGNVIITNISGGRHVTFSDSSDNVRLMATGGAGFVIKFELNGMSTSETLTGSAFGDVVQALGGNDSVYGGEGPDEIFGGLGNDTIEGGRDIDFLYGEAGDDVLDGGSRVQRDADDGYVTHYRGGPGNDTLYGDSAGDRYYFELGDGQDLIVDEPYFGNGQWHFSSGDELHFSAGITEEMLSGTQSGSDLVVNVTAADRITLQNWITNPMFRVDFLVFSDGTRLDQNAMLELAYTQRGGEGNDTLNGGENQADRLYGNDGNDVLNGLGGSDQLDGGTGDDALNGGTGDDRLDGGAGADALNGGDGNDTYDFGPGSGQDVITELGGSDTLEFAEGVSASSVVLSRNVNDLVLTLDSTPDAVTISGYFANPASRIEIFSFTDGSQLPGESAILDQFLNIYGSPGDDTLTGTAGIDALYGLDGDDALAALADNDALQGGSGNDTLTGGTGNDSLHGEEGDDLYQYALGDGQDLMADVAGFDTLTFGSGIAPTMVATTRSGADLVLDINVAGNTGQVRSQGYFSGQETEAIHFADGTVWDVMTIQARVLSASSTAGNDLILGYGSGDVISSLAGHDTVFAGAGDDTVDGGAGSDQLHGEAGNDTLTAGSGDSKNAAVNNYLYGGSGDDVLIASTKADFLYGDAGNDILRGSSGASVMNDSGGNNLIDAQNGNDALSGGNDNELVIGGTGLDSYDGDPDIDGSRGRDIIAFNKSDGPDTVARLGAGSTISIGGGTLYNNLALEAQGSALRLKTGSNHYVSLTDWYSAPANRAVSTLQIVIEGTRDYKASSSNPMANRKIQTFDFLGLVAAFDAAGRPGNFNVAANLPAFHLGGSDTDAIGGTIAYQYARTGNLGTLTYDQMRAILTAPEFAIAPQSIVPAVTSSTSEQPDALAAMETQIDAQGLPAGTTEGSEGGEGELNDLAASTGPVIRPMPASPTPQIESTLPVRGGAAAAYEDRGNRTANTAPQRLGAQAQARSDPLALADAAACRSAMQPGDQETSPTGAQQIGTQKISVAADLPSELDGLAELWFARRSPHEDLSLLDDIRRGETMANTQSTTSIAAAWEASHRWLSRQAGNRNAFGDQEGSGAGLSGLPLASGVDGTHDMPHAAVGLRNVPGHELRQFHGLRDGMRVLTQS